MGKSMTASELAAQETRYGVVPMLKGDRVYSFWDTLWVAGAYGIATWCYFQGGALASVMSFPQVILSSLGSACAAIFLILAVAVFTCRYGIDHWIYSRAVFGWLGASALLLVTLSTTWGYEAINAQLYGSSIIQLANAAGAEVDAGWAKWIGLTCVFFGWVIAIRGAIAVKMATRVMGVMLVSVGAMIVVILLVRGDMSALWSADPSAPLESGIGSYMLGTEWNIAFVLGWFPVIGALARLGKTERGTTWGMFGGYAVLFAAFIVIGGAVAFVGIAAGADASGDPTAYLMQVGGTWLGGISVLAIAIANITTQAVATYLMSVSTKILNPTWNYKIIATFWCVLSAVLTAWGAIWDYYPTFLAVIGVISGPALALLACDYWIVRRGRFNMGGLFKKGVYDYTVGFNLVAWVAFAAGAAGYFAVYDPINFAPRYEPIFNLFTATGFAALLTAVVYVGLTRIPALQRYVVRDTHLVRVGGTNEPAAPQPGQAPSLG